MGWGIMVNGMFLSRVRKDGLADYVREQNEYVQSITHRLVALTAYTSPVYKDGENEWPLPEYAALEIPTLVEELQTTAVNLAIARYALENPDEVTADE